jgi:tRNA 2-selenouridine synthase SelU
MSKIEWREDETFTEYKMRKHEGMQGMGQKTVKNREGWSDNQKRGLTNKNKGRRKQNLARKKLKIPDTKFRSQMGNEESWQGEVRVEVKAGKQVQTLWTKYQKAKEQSDKNVAIGDTRPFMFVAMPDGTSNGLVVVELDKLDEVVFALLETWEQ